MDRLRRGLRSALSWLLLIPTGLAYLGLELDESANRANALQISTASSRVRVAVEPTNEEWIAATSALQFLWPT